MRLKSKGFAFLLVFILGLQFFILPHFNNIISSLLPRSNDNMELSTNAIVLTLIHQDPVGDEIPTIYPSIDILDVYENKSMDLLNVSFNGPFLPSVVFGDQWMYMLFLDTNNDNSSWEYGCVYQGQNTGVNSNTSFIVRADMQYYNTTSSLFQPIPFNDSNFAYMQGNNMIFNFSSCLPCIGDNYYCLTTMYMGSANSQDYAISSYMTPVGAFFAGYSSKPSVDNYSISPRNALINSNFTINTNVNDPNGTDTVLAYIKSYPTLSSIAQIELFDDGLHDDGAAGDTIYGNSWNSTGQLNGTYCYDLFANDSLGSFRNVSMAEFFILGESKPSILRDDLVLDYYGYLNMTPIFYNNNWWYYSHYGISSQKDYYPNNAITPLHMMTTEAHITDNLTGIVTQSNSFYMAKGAFDHFWIHPDVEINESVYLWSFDYPVGTNRIYNVTGTEKISWENTEIWCWRLNSTFGDVAYFDNSTGILINATFNLTVPSDYLLYELQYSNEEIGIGPDLAFESPLNQTYYNSNVPLIITNETDVAHMWYRNNSGAGWGQNYSLPCISGNFNDTTLIWSDSFYQLEVYANDTIGRTTVIGQDFTVDTYGPEIYPNVYNLTRIGPFIELKVENMTEVHTMWYRNSTDGSAWSSNNSIDYDSGEGLYINDTLNISTTGTNYIQVFANKTSGEITLRQQIFNIQNSPANISNDINMNATTPIIKMDSRGNTYVLLTSYAQQSFQSSQLQLLNISNSWINVINITEYMQPYPASGHVFVQMDYDFLIDENDTIHISYSEGVQYYADTGTMGMGAMNYKIYYVNNELGYFSSPTLIPGPPGNNLHAYQRINLDSNGNVFISFFSTDYALVMPMYYLNNMSIWLTNNSLGYFSTPINITDQEDVVILLTGPPGNQIPLYSLSIDQEDRLHLVVTKNASDHVDLIYKNSDDWSKSQVLQSEEAICNLEMASIGSNISHVIWVNNDSAVYTLRYINNSMGDFNSPVNITQIIDSVGTVVMGSNTIDIEVSNETIENLVVIAWVSETGGGTFDLFYTHNNGTTFSDYPDNVTITNDLLNDLQCNLYLIPNPGELIISWTQSNTMGTASQIMLEETRVQFDYSSPTGDQDANTKYPSVEQAPVIWINGTAADAQPSSGLKSVEIINSNTSGGIADWSINWGNLTNWAFNNTVVLTPNIYQVNISIKDNQDNEVIVPCNVSVKSLGLVLNEPSNTTYNHSYIPITALNDSVMDKGWYRMNNGTGWSNNFSLTYSGGELGNDSILVWGQNNYQLQVFANDSVGYETMVEEFFIVDVEIPDLSNIEINGLSNGSTVTGSTIWINGSANSTGSQISSFTINNTDDFEIYTDPTGQDTSVFAIRNKTVIYDGGWALRINITDQAGNSNFTIVYFDVDNYMNENPTIDISDPTPDEYITGSVLIINGTVYGVSSEIDTIWVNNTANFNWSFSVDPSGTPGGIFTLVNISSIDTGYHSINITVNNTEGNSTYIVRSFYVDNEVPTINLTAPIINVTTGSVIRLNISLNGTGSALTLYYNDSRFTNTTDVNGTMSGEFSFTNNTDIADGLLAINFTVVDGAGLSAENISSIYVDNTIPNMAVTNMVNGSYRSIHTDNRIQVWFDATGSRISQVLVNDSNFGIQQSPINRQNGNFLVANLSDIHGYFCLNITIIDEAGLSNQTFVYFTIDAVAPYIFFDTLVNGSIITDQTIWINGTYNGTASYVTIITHGNGSLIDPAAFNPMQETGSFSFRNDTNWLPGNYSVVFSFTDFVGNGNLTLLQFTIDNVDPNVTVTTPANNSGVSDTTIWINGTTDGTGTNCTLYFNDTRFTESSGYVNNSLSDNFAFNSSTIPEGDLWLNLTLVDQTGKNETILLFIYVDRSDPTITIDLPANISGVAGDLWINGTVNGTNSPLTFYFNDTRLTSVTAINNTMSGNYNLTNNTVIPEGKLVINLTSVDLAGLSRTEILIIYIDNSDPTMTVTTPANGSIITGDLWINGTVNGTGSPLTLTFNDSRLTNTTNINGSLDGNYYIKNDTVLPDGYLAVELTVTDLVGYTESMIVYVYIDNSKPMMLLTNLGNGTIYQGNATLWINGTYDATGFQIASFTFNGTAYFELNSSSPVGQEQGTFSIRNHTVLFDGEYTIRINITDAAGFSNYTLVSFNVDNLVNENPVITLSKPSYNGSAINSTYIFAAYRFVIQGQVWGISNNTENLWVNSTNWTIWPGSDPRGSPGGNFVFVNTTNMLNGTYILNVTANNTDGNSTSIIITFNIDISAPPTPPNIGHTISGNNVTLTWDAAVDDTNVTYIIYRDGVLIGNTTNLNYTDPGLPDGTYVYTVYVIDNGGNICATAAQRTVTLGAITTPPPDLTILIIIILIIVIGAFGAVGGIVVAKKRKSRPKQYFPDEKPEIHEQIKKIDAQKPVAKVVEEKGIGTHKPIIPPPKPVPMIFPSKPKPAPVTPKKSTMIQKIPGPRAQPVIIRPKAAPVTPKTTPTIPKIPAPKPAPVTQLKEFVYTCPTCDKYFKVTKEGTFNCPTCKKPLNLFKS